MKTTARRLLARAGIQVTRSPFRHRFDATDDALAVLGRAGFRPRVVIDGGANVGAWTTAARRHFPDAVYHLIEPQPACRPALSRVAGARDCIHEVAIAPPGITRVRMTGGGEGGTGTGARVSRSPDDHDAIEVEATTLDALLLDLVRPDDRALLKLDLEGHEVEALRGATALLPRLEVLIAEVRFFEINRNGMPVFPEVLRAAQQAGFVLYDVAALAARPRDGRLRMGDIVFVSDRSPLLGDVAWE